MMGRFGIKCLNCVENNHRFVCVVFYLLNASSLVMNFGLKMKLKNREKLEIRRNSTLTKLHLWM